ARQCERQSLFQVLFALQNARQHTLVLPDLAIQVLDTHPVAASACELAISLRESSQGLEGLCIYQTALFDAPTITRLLEDYRQILECLVAQPELHVATLHARRKAASALVCQSPARHL